MPEKRTVPRKIFDMHMAVYNDDTGLIFGHMVEVSKIGFRLETVGPQQLGKDFYLRIELTPDLGPMPFIVFIARSKWCQMDKIQPNLYQVGFELVEIVPEDMEVYVKIMEKYAGKPSR